MRIAAISDIHGNIAALDAVLADIGRQGVDMVVNLGDIVSGALHPVETADRLMALAIPTVRGNHERQVLDLPLGHMGPSDRHAALTLRPDQRKWMAGLPETVRLPDDVLLVHGTPDSDITHLLYTVTPTHFREASNAEVTERVASADTDVILCGHTHLARAVRLSDARLVVNPGSVGLPAFTDDRPYPYVVESGSPHARYAVVARRNGEWSAELIKVEYDWESAAREAERNGRPDWATALRTGFV